MSGRGVGCIAGKSLLTLSSNEESVGPPLIKQHELLQTSACGKPFVQSVQAKHVWLLQIRCTYVYTSLYVQKMILSTNLFM